LGTVSLTIVVSFDAEDNSSLISIVEFNDKIGLSFEFEFIGLFTFDNNDEHALERFQVNDYEHIHYLNQVFLYVDE
jgi:hypothetical protein